MNLFEAKQILKKNGYVLSKNDDMLDEGIIQGIKDRWNDRKLKKDMNKAADTYKTRRGWEKDGDTTIAETEKSIKFVQEILKKYRGVKTSFDVVKEIDEKSHEVLNYSVWGIINIEAKSIKDKIEEFEGKPVTEFLRKIITDQYKSEGYNSFEEYVKAQCDKDDAKDKEKSDKYFKDINDEEEQTKWHQTESVRYRRHSHFI